MQSHPGYTEARCSAFVCDITEETLSSRLRENSVDIALMIFVLSAISPNNMIPALKNIFQVSTKFVVNFFVSKDCKLNTIPPPSPWA